MIDYRRLRPSDLRDLPRLYVPPPRPEAEEVEFSVKEHMWDRKTRFFMDHNCDGEGIIIKDNMTRSERRAFIKLPKSD